MAETKGNDTNSKDSPEKSFQIAAPTITMPKGGGAIRGMGEKFAANPVTGTGSMTVPIATSPGRSGFGPQLSLSYDSGAGNGPFGFGWSLSLPSITRKTDKGLPQYLDGQKQASDSDIFILSGAEDLVPEFEKNASGDWIITDGKQVVHDKPRTVDGVAYRVRRYRPRIEGLFARIERWTNQADSADVFWRSISKDNVTTWYGKTAESRIQDPTDSARIFSWLICQTHDDKGNVLVYGYKPEDSKNVDASQAHERNRIDRFPSAQRYLKRIRYGNRRPYLPELKENKPWPEPPGANAPDGSEDWLFEVVFDYDEPHYQEQDPDGEQRVFATASPTEPQTSAWPVRKDPFSAYRAGFEARTYRLCQRVLMFHHFPGETNVGRDCLVRSTDFTYEYEQDPRNARVPIYSFLQSVTQSGYVRQSNQYLKKSLPPVEFTYSKPEVQDLVEEVDPESVENLPVGLDGAAYQWTDLHGEGIPGILSEQGGTWFYKRNWSPLPDKLPDGSEVVKAKFSALETVALKPSVALSRGAQFMDLAGDGQPDLVALDGPTPGLYEHDEAEGWEPFRPFTARLNRNISDPNMKFVDLDGDGHADVLITEDDAFVWHESLGEEGFGSARRVAQSRDEEKGPRIVFADGTQSIYLADLSGDGLTGLVRIRNGEVCYWPNLGYGTFGAKVTMDNAPWFDHSDQFDHQRIRLADIDGSGTTDIIYLHRDGVRLYFNQSGNSWSQPHLLSVFLRIDDVVSIVPTDLLGNGTACLVWSSFLPGDARRPMRYVNLMGNRKPHVLVKTINNLGAETRVEYAPSTKFYLLDKRDGTPWITRLPFPVHVVERVETYDHISRNRFVTRYSYHHGYFDGEEREFRGFGRVDQLDTEEFAVLTEHGTLPEAANIDAASHVPPVLTKTWFHTGVYLGSDRVSNFFAGLLDERDTGEYYPSFRSGAAAADAAAKALLLDDTILPSGLTLEEEREACRALKGSMLRQEVYALDGTDKEKHPYTVAEQNFTIRALQPRDSNRHGVFFTHARESLGYHYERNPADPRVNHALTLEVDNFGNVLKSTAIGYGRRPGQSLLQGDDKEKQEQTLITYTENCVTTDHDTGLEAIDQRDDYRTPLPCESRTYELTGKTLPTGSDRFTFNDILDAVTTASVIDYERALTAGRIEKRLIEHVRTYYRRNDLTGALPLGHLQSLALPFESYKLAFTPGLAKQIFVDSGKLSLADLNSALTDGAKYGHTEGDANWWIPSGQIFYDPANMAGQELAYARQHFFLPHRYRNPFHTNAVSTESFVTYDIYDLLVHETLDALGNRVTVGERQWVLANGTVLPQRRRNDYRVLQPELIMDPNRNCSEVRFDPLGMVVGTAVMGKPEENPRPGDRFTAAFHADLTQAEIDQFLANPKGPMAATLLSTASTRVVYDLTAYRREPDPAKKMPAVAATLSRETHVSDLAIGEQTKVQVSLSYSDGFGREIQKKIQAEKGKVPQRDSEGRIIVGPDNQPVMSTGDELRWVGSGWTVFNNKGKPVRQYEPFFTDTHRFEFDVRIGVSPVLFYDPVERVVATLHPNHTWEKVVFDPWRQETWDVNGTVVIDPQLDPDLNGFLLKPDGLPRLPVAEYEPSWHALRTDGAYAEAFASRYPDATDRTNEVRAAVKTRLHAATPTVVHADSLGRTFLTVAHNRYRYSNPLGAFPVEEFYTTRIVLDIEGNQREVIDAKDRTVMSYVYDMLGNRVHQDSMEAGKRWMLNDVAGKPLYAWDSRTHRVRTAYDKLRRPTDSFLSEAGGSEKLVSRSIYGESRLNPESSNLRGKVVELRDQAGIVTSDLYDFKGNLRRNRRQLAETVGPAGFQAPAYKTTVDWNGAVQLSAENYASRTRYDALNRPTQLIVPHSDQSGATVNVIQLGYNDANLLEKVDAWLNRNVEPGNLLDPATADLRTVTNIDYDAKGQRTQIDYGNDATTTYTYDPLIFRLSSLQTTRASDNATLQDLHYTYDPAGNITSIRDDAQQTIYFKNKRVEPSAEYVYDAVYRLIEATGREHLGQVGGSPIPHSYNDTSRVGIQSPPLDDRFHPQDGNAMARYCECYEYDPVGNIMEMIHRVACPGPESWRRSYTYDEESQLDPAVRSNRLTSTTIGATTETYSTIGDGYDAHGNMLRMPHLQIMQWDFKDQLQMTQRQNVNNQDADGVLRHGERTWYVYDSAGQRVRKVTESAVGQVKDERIYLGGFEIYRKNGGTPLVRETLHIMDDKQRVALVETRAQGTDSGPQQLFRYQFGNHLGSASLELDGQAEIISYEEYTPYGSSTYQAVRSQTETPKRYRFSAKERDEENGLYYYGLRYFAPWLGRWTVCDPEGAKDGLNLFAFVRGNPIRYSDMKGGFSLETLEKTFTSGSMKSPGQKHSDPIFAQLKEGYSVATSRSGTFDLGPKDKYLYTTHAGIVDVQHFLGAAKDVYAGHVLLKQDLPVAKEKTLKALEQNERGTWVGRPYAQDDLPSNALGTLFGEHLINLKAAQPKKGIDVAEEATKFLKHLGPLDEKDLTALKKQGLAKLRGKSTAETAEPISIIDEIIEATGDDKSPHKHLKGKTEKELLKEKEIELDPAITVKDRDDDTITNIIGLKSIEQEPPNEASKKEELKNEKVPGAK